MFQMNRALDARQIYWSSPRSELQGCIYYFNGWQNHDTQTHTTSYLQQEGWLKDSEIQSWLRQEGRFALPTAENSQGRQSSGFRLLICERTGSEVELPLSEDSFTRVEDSFNLSPLTLSSLLKFTGIYSKHTRRRSDNGDIESIDVVIKATAKFDISNALVSLNHNYERQWTDVFICGQGLLRAMKPHVEQEFGKHFDYIFGSIKACGPLWNHPLFLPTIIIQDASRRSYIYLERFSAQMTDLENRVGITRAGRARPGKHVTLDRWPEGIDFKGVTLDLHSLGPQIVFVNHVTAWILDCSRFLLELANDIKPPRSSDAGNWASLKQSLEYEVCSIEGVDRYLGGYQERLRAQINVLLSASTQKDTAQTIKLGILTKRDSVAMMAFTFITALFLPGTAIATLFSMPIFDWGEPSTSFSGSVSVTANFWIYWAVTAPLTVAVMAGWYAWYLYKNWDWQRKTDLQMWTETKSVHG